MSRRLARRPAGGRLAAPRLTFLQLAAAAWLASVAACTTPPPPPPTGTPAATGPVAMALSPVGFGQLPGWSTDRQADALRAFLRGCGPLSGGKALGGQGDAARLGGSPEQWRAACSAARSVPANDDTAARAFFERAFQPYAITGNGSATGLFTGYYEPEVRGARVRGGSYATPLLSRPANIVSADLGAFSDDLKGRTLVGRVQGGTFIPYFDRAQIDGGALAGQGLELLWLADPVDAFFLEIQGSGRVQLADGGVVRVTYGGQNGRPYVPIGRVLIERGEIPREQVSLQSIRAWLAAHPAQARGVMDQNPSYVFFRELAGTGADTGPPGALGANLTPGRSLAVDRAFLPLGAPVWLDAADPLGGPPIRRLMVAQDTGGAIKGPVRGDVFWGWGADAETRAGTMKSSGSSYILLPRGG